jgi:hypothetical protein
MLHIHYPNAIPNPLYVLPYWLVAIHRRFGETNDFISGLIKLCVSICTPHIASWRINLDMRWTSAVAIQRESIGHTERVGLLRQRLCPSSFRSQHSTAQHSTAQHNTAQYSTAQHAISAVQRPNTTSALDQWATAVGLTDIWGSALHTKWQSWVVQVSDLRGRSFHYAKNVINLRACSGQQRYWLHTERWVNVLCAGWLCDGR